MEQIFHSEPAIDPALKQESEDLGTEKETTQPDEAQGDEGKGGKEGEKPQTADEQVEEILEIAGLDMSELAKEFQKDGKLSEESYEELKEAGFPKSVVDAYIKGVEKSQAEANTLAEKDVAEILSVAGGNEGYETLMAWASSSFSEEEKEAFNRAVNMGDKYIAKLAVQGLVARYEAEYGRDPKLVNGGGRAVEDSGKDGFKSRSDMTAAMSDKRYGRDPDYTREVERKVINSGLMSRGKR